MKRLNILSILLVACISSFFFVNKVDALFKDVDSKTNTFTITDKGNYVVIHKLMDLNGEYTIIDSPNDEGEELLGTEVILPVRSYTGFKQPEEQAITIEAKSINVTSIFLNAMTIINIIAPIKIRFLTVNLL